MHFTALPPYLLKSACCFANLEFPVCEDEQALLERFLLSGCSKKTESVNHQLSSPRKFPIKSRLWTSIKFGKEPTMSNHCQQLSLHNESGLDLKTNTSKPSSIWRPETNSVACVHPYKYPTYALVAQSAIMPGKTYNPFATALKFQQSICYKVGTVKLHDCCCCNLSVVFNMKDFCPTANLPWAESQTALPFTGFTARSDYCQIFIDKLTNV